MIGRIEYPHIPDGTASPQLKNELWRLVDQINAVLAEVESRIGAEQGGNKNAG